MYREKTLSAIALTDHTPLSDRMSMSAFLELPLIQSIDEQTKNLFIRFRGAQEIYHLPKSLRLERLSENLKTFRLKRNQADLRWMLEVAIDFTVISSLLDLGFSEGLTLRAPTKDEINNIFDPSSSFENDLLKLKEALVSDNHLVASASDLDPTHTLIEKIKDELIFKGGVIILRQDEPSLDDWVYFSGENIHFFSILKGVHALDHFQKDLEDNVKRTPNFLFFSRPIQWSFRETLTHFDPVKDHDLIKTINLRLYDYRVGMNNVFHLSELRAHFLSNDITAIQNRTTRLFDKTKPKGDYADYLPEQKLRDHFLESEEIIRNVLTGLSLAP